MGERRGKGEIREARSQAARGRREGSGEQGKKKEKTRHKLLSHTNAPSQKVLLMAMRAAASATTSKRTITTAKQQLVDLAGISCSCVR